MIEYLSESWWWSLTPSALSSSPLLLETFDIFGKGRVNSKQNTEFDLAHNNPETPPKTVPVDTLYKAGSWQKGSLARVKSFLAFLRP